MEDPQGCILRLQIDQCSFLALSTLELESTTKGQFHVTKIAVVHKVNKQLIVNDLLKHFWREGAVYLLFRLGPIVR